MLATLGSSWRRGSKALEPISSFRLLTASILQQPSATLNFGTGFTSFFCIKVPETPIERVRQRHIESRTDSVMKDSVPELKEATSNVKIALEHLKNQNTSQTLTSFGGSGDASDEKSSTVEWTEEIYLDKYKSDEGGGTVACVQGPTIVRIVWILHFFKACITAIEFNSIQILPGISCYA